MYRLADSRHPGKIFPATSVSGLALALILSVGAPRLSAQCVPNAPPGSLAAEIDSDFGVLAKSDQARAREDAAESLKELSPDFLELDSGTKACVAQRLATLMNAPDVNGRPDVNVQFASIGALRQMGPDAKPAVQALIQALKDPGSSDFLRQSAANALSAICGSDPETLDKDSVGALASTAADHNTPDFVRVAAILALGRTSADVAWQTLVKIVQDPNEPEVIRTNAAQALHDYWEGAGPASHDTSGPTVVPALTGMLDAGEVHIRAAGAKAIQAMGKDAKSATSKLVEVLQQKSCAVGRSGMASPECQVQANAATALGAIGPGAKDADSHTVSALADAVGQSPDPKVRYAAAVSLGEVGVGVEGLRPLLLALLNPDSDVRGAAWDSLRSAGADVLLHGYHVWVILIYLLLLLIWILLLYVSPLWILYLSELLKDPDVAKKLPGMFPLLAKLVLLRFFEYHPRVLDAWVRRHVAAARNAFLEKDVVRDRQVHVAVPVGFNGRTLAELGPGNLRSEFARNGTYLLIWGEGGAGKTSLACQLAKWAMSEDESERLSSSMILPVLVESDLELTRDQEASSLQGLIRERLDRMIGTDAKVPKELFEHLLRRRRLLVIVDGFSEMSEPTRQIVRKCGDGNSAIRALIVTARAKERFAGITLNPIEPQRIEGNRLSSFMEAYLVKREKKAFFNDSEFFSACQGLSSMIGQRNITVLLAKLYADQMIAFKERQDGAVSEADETPKNIPQLMYRYLNDLNLAVSAAERLDDRIVQRIAKTVAWECLKETFQPAAAKVDVIGVTLGDGADEQVKYLMDRLRLLQTTLDRNRVRFSLDPVAEYFAGMHVVEDLGTDEARWRGFLEALDKGPRGLVGIRAFLLAARDCCQASPDPVWSRAAVELEERAGERRESPEIPPLPVPPVPRAGLPPPESPSGAEVGGPN